MQKQQSLTNLFFVGKIKDKYFIFTEGHEKGQMIFEAIPNEFHTAEDAHLWLIETAKTLTTDKDKRTCVEIEKQYMFVKECESKNNKS